MNRKNIAVAISALAFSTSAFAQLEEVLVTAQKREQSLQEVPIAISAVSGELLEQTGVNTIFRAVAL
jgi:iron complex outermembrane receptor protein